MQQLARSRATNSASSRETSFLPAYCTCRHTALVPAVDQVHGHQYLPPVHSSPSYPHTVWYSYQQANVTRSRVNPFTAHLYTVLLPPCILPSIALLAGISDQVQGQHYPRLPVFSFQFSTIPPVDHLIMYNLGQ